MRTSKVAKRYARALLTLGQEDGQYEQYGRDLRDFTQFCQKHEEFAQVIGNRVFKIEHRKEILQAVLKRSPYSDLVRNFLNLLLDKNRIGAVREISEYYERLTDEISNIARAQVVAARPLKEEAAAKLRKTLESLTSKQVVLHVAEDESLIGGMVVKVGDLVLDGSVKTQLEGLKESLKRGEYS